MVVEKDGDGLWVLRLAYELRVPFEEPNRWLKLTSKTIKFVVARGDYVVVDLGKKR